MTQNVTAVTHASTAEAMASADPARAHREFFIADISLDGAWLSMPASEAPSLREGV